MTKNLILLAMMALCLLANAAHAQSINYKDTHLQGKNPLAAGESIDLTNESQWLFFDDMKPSEVLNLYSSLITVKGEALMPDVNCRVLIYRHGSVVVPQGKDNDAFTLYSGTHLTGESEAMKMYRFYTNEAPVKAPEDRVAQLKLDNRGRSFLLRRGHMATLATRADGMGYSRVFVADTADLQIDELPETLDGKVSFVRVLPWQYVSKKGWAGSKWDTMPEGLKYAFEQAEFTNSTWYYNWGTSPTTNPKKEGKNFNVEFVPEVWGATSSTSKPYSLVDASHLMGFNEPDHSEQSNVSVEKAISIWPELMKTGMRLGSPATTDFSWLYSFMNECKKRNYRVDYVVVHAYWGGLTGMDWYKKLKDVYDHTKRPIWIKEWNNGANWTKESWPSGTSEQQAKQLRDLEQILTVMDTCSFIERYSIYNWVEDKRAIILGSTAKLTPAGKYYAEDQPDYFYKDHMQFIPSYTPRKAPVLSSSTNGNGKVTLEWEDEESEFISQYIIEKSFDSSAYVPVTQLPKGAKSYDIAIDSLSTGSQGKGFSLRVVAVTDNGNQLKSNPVSFSVLQTGDLRIPHFSEMLIREKWSTALYEQSIEDEAVVVLGTPTYRNKMPVTYRAKNLTDKSFEYGMVTWDYQESPEFAYPDTIAVMIARKDCCQLGSLKTEVGVVEGVTDEWQHVSFVHPFPGVPVVIPTEVSSVVPSAASARVRNVTADGFDLCLQYEAGNAEMEKPGDAVSFLAIEQGRTQVENMECVVGVTEDGAVQDNLLGGTRVEYGCEFTSMPLCFAAMQTDTDGIASVLRIKSRNLTGATLIKDREKSLSHERVAGEKVGFVALGETRRTAILLADTSENDVKE